MYTIDARGNKRVKEENSWNISEKLVNEIKKKKQTKKQGEGSRVLLAIFIS